MATACAVVVLTSLGGYQFLPTTAQVPPAVSASPSPTGPAEYEQGRRLMAHNVAPLSAKTVSLTWIPTAENTILELRCHDVGSIQVFVEIRLNGTLRNSGSCSATIVTNYESWPELRPGEPVTLVVNAVSATRTDPDTDQTVSVPIPAIGVLEATVRQQVPFEQCPLPARPADLKPLRDRPACQGVQSDPADPRLPVRHLVSWR